MSQFEGLRRGRNHYELLVRIGHSKEGSVYKAKYLPTNTLVAVKIYDRWKVDHDDYARQIYVASTYIRCSNVVRIFCQFKYNDHVWVVMNYMHPGSIKSIMLAYFPDGLSESSIACILKQTLVSLMYGQHHRVINRNLNFGHLYLDANGVVKVAYDVVQYEDLANQPLVLPHWAYAPELKRDAHIWGYRYVVGIWMFGVTALQLAYGGLPACNVRDWDLLIKKITAQYGPQRKMIPKFVRKFMSCSEYSGIPCPKHGKKLSRSFWEMVALCFQEPRKRPDAHTLSSHKFFINNCSKFDDPREPFAQEVLSIRSSLPDSHAFQHEEGVDEWSFYDEMSRSSSCSSFSSSNSSL